MQQTFDSIQLFEQIQNIFRHMKIPNASDIHAEIYSDFDALLGLHNGGHNRTRAPGPDRLLRREPAAEPLLRPHPALHRALHGEGVLPAVPQSNTLHVLPASRGRALEHGV